MKTKNIVLKTASWASNALPVSLKKQLYKIPFLAKFIRRSLNAAAPSGLSETTIASGAVKGIKMMLDLQSEKDYWLGTYEPDLQEAARNLIHPGDVVYDVGANIGYISLMSAVLSGSSGRVFSFEALPINVQRLKKNVALNKLGARITVIHGAVIGSNSPVSFLTHSSTSMGKVMGAAGRDEQYTGSITVPGLTLDHFVYQERNPAPDLIKIDIEGGEGQALSGMPRLLAKIQPVLLIELHGKEAAHQTWNILQKHAYKVHRMVHGYPLVKSAGDLDWKAYIIAVAGHKQYSLTQKPASIRQHIV